MLAGLCVTVFLVVQASARIEMQESRNVSEMATGEYLTKSGSI